MPDSRLVRCLELCRQSSKLRGDALEHCLERLGNELEQLLHQSPSAPAIGGDTSVAWVHEPVIAMDIGGFITAWNEGAENLFGYSAEEAIGRHILFLYADEPADQEATIHELFLDQENPFMEVRRRKKTGEIFRANLSLSHLLDEAECRIGMIARLSEISDRLSDDDRKRLHARIIEDSEEGILITDTNEQIVSVNSAFSRITGYSASEAIGCTPDLLRSGVHSADFRAMVRGAMHGAGAWQGEIVGKRKNGELFPQSVSIGVVRDLQGEVTHAFSIFSDISVLRAAQERMQQMVNYDGLTGLPNRNLFRQLSEQALASARRNQANGALLIIDLSRFAAINDSLSHEVGDELLRQVGQRFRNSLRDEDILARLGGDEFVVTLVHIHKREHSGLVAEKLLESLKPLFLIESHALHIEARIGIANYPDDGLTTDELLRAADVAIKRVQEKGETGYLFFGPEMNIRAKEQWQLESELREAITTSRLLLYYQPKVSLRNGRIVGAEALIRWPHRQHGMIPPARFVPLAEETGLIFDLGNWILEAACHQIRQWMEAGLTPIPIAINLSARQFDAELPARITDTLDRHGIPCELLRLEITESLLIRGPEAIIPIMNELVSRGLNLSLDDFGTGYSSLAYLKRFPISTLKIDRSFVIGVPDDENDCAIAQAIVTMGKQLHHEIVAEGVETPAQMAFLRHLGCDQLQGYLFSPPVPAEELEQMIRERKRLPLEEFPSQSASRQI